MDNVILIDDNVLQLSKDVCKYVNDSFMRNRSVANVLAVNLAKEYLAEHNCDVKTGLHNVSHMLNSWDIADIYVNGCYLDVRVSFQGDSLSVPKIHFDKELLPIAYMFIEVNSDLSEAIVKGFILPENIDKTVSENGSYLVEESGLSSFKDIEYLFSSNVVELPDNFEKNLHDYLDGVLEDMTSFEKLLITSKEARIKFISAANVKNMFNFVSIDSIMQQDSQQELLYADDNIESVEEDVEDVVENNISLDSENSLDDLYQDTTDLDLDANLAEEFDLNEDVISDDIEDISSDNILDDITGEEIEDLEENLVEEFSSDESSFEFSTVATPSIDSIEEELEDVDTDGDSNLYYEEIVSYDNNDEDDSVPEIEYQEAIADLDTDILADSDNYASDDTEFIQEDDSKGQLSDAVETFEQPAYDNNSPQLESLFTQGSGNTPSEVFEAPAKTKSVYPMLGAVIIIAMLGYMGYTKFLSNSPAVKSETKNVSTNVINSKNAEPVTPVAMPVESVDADAIVDDSDIGNALSIPAIEQNLDASILISNLSVNWEVPASYASNPAAKRYFTKLGKIIQLNLKTELLLLSKPPITNKIALDLEFDKSTQRFVVKDFSVSSGEKIVDDLIAQTVRKALAINLNMNMSIFNNVQGAPVLIIRL